MYKSTLDAAIAHPETAVVSPSLLGSTGKVTLTIVSTIPDIMRYHHEAIASAQSEVLLATNTWEPGPSVSQISTALVKLNHQAQAENRRVAVKLIMDTPSIRNAIESRFVRKPNTWESIGLPKAEDVPHLDMEVINYHAVPLGTFHSKFTVVDRRFALVHSNNINVRSNVEMMVRLEGDIIYSLYDTFYISWGREPSAQEANVKNDADPISQAQAEQQLFDKFEQINRDFQQNGNLTEHLDVSEKVDHSHLPEINDYTPFYYHYPSLEAQVNALAYPMCLVNRQPYRYPCNQDVVNPQNNAWLSAFKYARHHIFIQSPVFNAWPLFQAVVDACKRDVIVELWTDLGFNDLAEGLIPFQGGTNVQFAEKLFTALIALGKDHNLHYHFYTAKDQIAPQRFDDQTRNCHVKFMAVDLQVCIMGSGNMDTQSWFHSQETNVMVDSQQAARQWRNIFEQNQNTYQHGRIDGKNLNTLLETGQPLPPKIKSNGISRAKGGFL